MYKLSNSYIYFLWNMPLNNKKIKFYHACTTTSHIQYPEVFLYNWRRRKWFIIIYSWVCLVVLTRYTIGVILSHNLVQIEKWSWSLPASGCDISYCWWHSAVFCYLVGFVVSLTHSPFQFSESIFLAISFEYLLCFWYCLKVPTTLLLHWIISNIVITILQYSKYQLSCVCTL